MNLGMGIAEKNGLRLSEMDLDTQYLLLTWIDNIKKNPKKTLYQAYNTCIFVHFPQK